MKDINTQRKNCYRIGGNIVCKSESGTSHGGGGTRLPFINNEQESIDDNEFCFYINKRYKVTRVYSDFDDNYYGTVPVFGEDYNFLGIRENTSRGIFSTISNFISRISGTVGFINENIYNLYNSMPLLLQMFIVSVLSLIILKIIIDMVVRQYECY